MSNSIRQWARQCNGLATDSRPMPEDEKRNERLTDNEKDYLKLPETDIMCGMVLKSLSEQNVSSIRKVSIR